jgi:hypothetical protein
MKVWTWWNWFRIEHAGPITTSELSTDREWALSVEYFRIGESEGDSPHPPTFCSPPFNPILCVRLCSNFFDVCTKNWYSVVTYSKRQISLGCSLISWHIIAIQPVSLVAALWGNITAGSWPDFNTWVSETVFGIAICSCILSYRISSSIKSSFSL